MPPRKKQPTDEGIVAELLSLLQQVTSDGKLSDGEIFEVRQWLDDNVELKVPGIEFLRTCLNHALADGTITESERAEIHKAVERTLPVELRREARERRTAVQTIEKAKAKEQKEKQRELEREEKSRNRPTGSANFMVAGVTYEGRADTIDRWASIGAPVFLLRDSKNPHDSNAIEIRLKNGMDIGFAPREFAEELAPKLDRGDRHVAHITKILSGRRAPIPVVQAYLYQADADIAGSVAQPEISNQITSALRERPAGGCCGCTSALCIVILFLVALVLFGR